MLPKKQKLPRQLFPQRKDQISLWSGGTLRISVNKTKEKQSKARFAVVVPKHLSKGAVSRNVFKRKVMGILKDNTNVPWLFPQVKYVIYPTKKVDTLILKDIETDIKDFLKKN